jgi:hypothetical protein
MQARPLTGTQTGTGVFSNAFENSDEARILIDANSPLIEPALYCHSLQANRERMDDFWKMLLQSPAKAQRQIRR